MRGIKTIFRRTNLLATALALALSVFIGVAPVHATAATVVWTGAAGDNKLATAGNWQGGVAPVAGDIIKFNNAIAGATLTNNLGIALGGVTLATVGSTQSTFSIDTLTLQPGATLMDTQDGSVSNPVMLSIASLTAQGDLVTASSGLGFNIYGGAWTVNGTLNVTGRFNIWTDTLLANAINVTGQSNGVRAGVSYGGPLTGSSMNITTPFTLGGATSTASPSIVFSNSQQTTVLTYNLSGNVTLNSNAQICASGNNVVVNITGLLTANGHTLSKATSSICNGTVNFNWGNGGSGGSTQTSPATLPTPTQQGTTYNTYSSTNTSSGAFSDPLTSSTSAAQTTVITKSFSQAANGFTAGANVPIVEGTINMSSGSADLTGATLDSSLTSYSAVAHNFANTTTNGQYTLFVPYRSGDKAVGICPGAASLAVVSSSCPNLYYLADGQSKTSKDTASIPAGVTVTAHIQTINGSQYWQVSGLTGTGGFSTPATPPNTGFFAPTLANPAFVAVLGLASLAALALVLRTAKR